MSFQQPSLFGQPVARTGDPSTSWDAARSVDLSRRTRTQREILGILGAHGPLTDEEIAGYAAARGSLTSPSGLRTRRAELVDRGAVVDTGQRRLTQAGRRTIVWGLL